ncbi:MAG: CHAT domain-containing tetratricopeptide repeat protein, partial [Bacteroidota bacterium]
YLQEELAILERIGYQNDEYYSIAMQDLSRIYHQRGDLSLALETLNSALEILEKRVPPEHQLYRHALWEKATICQNLKDYEAAANILRRIEVLEQKPLAIAVRHLSDQELSAFTTEYYEYLSREIALAEYFPAISDLFYDKILRYKGFLLSNTLAVRKNAQANEDTKALYRQLRGLNRRLAALYSNYEADEQEIQELENQAEIIEKEMVRQQSVDEQLSFDVNWQKVQAQLSTKEAALELVTYQQFSRPNEPFTTHYAGLLLLPEVENPLFVRLGAEDSLAHLLNITTNDVKAIDELYQWSRNGQQLYQVVWQPIQAVLEEYPAIEKLFVSSDGLLHRINISAIPIAEQDVVAKNYEVVTLTSTRNLLLAQPNDSPQPQKAVLYGGIDYGTIETTMSSTSVDEEPIAETRSSRSTYSETIRGYDPNNGYWQPLTWTEVEVMYAHEVLQEAGYKTDLYTAEEATEDQLKAILEENVPPQVIHLATHGYFFESPAKNNQTSHLPFGKAKKDLVRSGLILANGNYAWLNGQSHLPDQEDGILTALELSLLNLNGTELVILSACETGLGKIQKTEGVYGLQRALKLAGAEYIIISLWQIPDYQTQAFISSFYTAWLEEGAPISSAFNTAQAYMRARYKAPFDWAGFILIR